MKFCRLWIFLYRNYSGSYFCLGKNWIRDSSTYNINMLCSEPWPVYLQNIYYKRPVSALKNENKVQLNKKTKILFSWRDEIIQNQSVSVVLPRLVFGSSSQKAGSGFSLNECPDHKHWFLVLCTSRKLDLMLQLTMSFIKKFLAQVSGYSRLLPRKAWDPPQQPACLSQQQEGRSRWGEPRSPSSRG
jgi:hypothetical protein